MEMYKHFIFVKIFKKDKENPLYICMWVKLYMYFKSHNIKKTNNFFVNK